MLLKSLSDLLLELDLKCDCMEGFHLCLSALFTCICIPFWVLLCHWTPSIHPSIYLYLLEQNTTSMKLPSVLYLEDLEISEGEIKSGAVGLMKNLRPHWDPSEMKITVSALALFHVCKVICRSCMFTEKTQLSEAILQQNFMWASWSMRIGAVIYSD